MMHFFSDSGLQRIRHTTCKWMIPVCWITGLILGMIFAGEAGSSFFLMMRGDSLLTVSIPGLLLVTALPFLLTAAAVFLSQFWLLLLLILAKGITFGFCAFGITTVYAGASWLMCVLLMFGDACALPLLMGLWLHHGTIAGKHFVRDLCCCIAAALILGVLDVCYVAPFAAALI